MIDLTIQLMLLAVASGTVALALTASHLTKRWRHEYLDAPFLIGELINCPYCMGFWTAVPFAFVAPSASFLEAATQWLIITGLSHLYMGAAQRLFLFRESENEELREVIRDSRETILDLTGEKNGTEVVSQPAA